MLWIQGPQVADRGSRPTPTHGANRHCHIVTLLLCRQHLGSACKSVAENNVNLAAFFAWSFLDSFEWADGYRARYGIVHVDRASKTLQRSPKQSALWLSQHFFRCGRTQAWFSQLGVF